MLSVEKAISILDELFESELKACIEDQRLLNSELVAIQTLYDYVKFLEGSTKK